MISSLTRLRRRASFLQIYALARIETQSGSLGDRRRSLACVGASKYERKLTQDASFFHARRILRDAKLFDGKIADSELRTHALHTPYRRIRAKRVTLTGRDQPRRIGRFILDYFA